MIYEAFYENFSDALCDLIPDRKELLDFICNALHIDKRAASRRLQGDYQFRINEVLQLCSILDISLDNMIPKKGHDYYPPSFMYYPFDHLTKKNYDSIYAWLDKFKVATTQKGSYVLFSSNFLPEIFCFRHENLVRFYKLKWAYYMEDPSTKNYMDDEMVLAPAHWSVIREYISTIFNFEKLLIIWDYNIIPTIIKDIEYFMRIGYLTLEHKQLLKEDLFHIIDQINDLCKEYTTAEHTSDFTFAISSVYQKKTHSIIKGDDFKIAVDSAFYTTYLYVRDTRIVNSVEHIIMSTLKSSVVISQSNEQERIRFIAEQRKLVEEF